MKKIIFTAFSAILVLLAMTSATKRPVTLFIIGDSTAANKDISNDKQERGWGMELQGFFTDKVLVENHAVNGRSSKSFIDEGRWQTVLQRIQPGDYVFIQFGHNDEKPPATPILEPHLMQIFASLSLRPKRKVVFLFY